MRVYAIGDNVVVGEATRIRTQTTVGNNVQIAAKVDIAKGVVIGDNVMIGQNCAPAQDENDPPCVRTGQGSHIAGDNVIGVNVTLRKNIIVPTNHRVADDTSIRANTTVSNLCD